MSRYPTARSSAMTEYEGRMSMTSVKGEMSCGSSGAKTVPCNLAGATSHAGPQGVTPATSE